LGWLLLGLLLVRCFARFDAVDAQLRHVTHGLLEGRPVLRLIRRELEAGLHRGDPRVGECGNIHSAQPMAELGALSVGVETAAVAIAESPTAETLLCVDETRARDGKKRRRSDDRL
ncbi:MAG TPA: hypothetical protein VE396_10520, partial [Xanthobacteraceae bacterium]|nr:hypothetical protein [Xanthobacteraceae bacterium]